MSLVYTVPATTTAAAAGKSRNSVYIGGRAEAKSLEKLQRWGISRILNVTPAKETSIQAGVPNFFEKSGQFVYKRIPVYDAATSATALEGQAQEIVSFISNGLFHGSVLVHCHHGVSRSTTCAVMYLMRKIEMSLADAMKLVQRRRPQAQPIPAFMQLLERYEKQCRDTEQQQSSNGGSSANNRSIDGPPQKKPRVAMSMMGPSIGPPRGPTVGATATATAQTKEGPDRGTIIGPSRGPAVIGPSRGPTQSSPDAAASIKPSGSTEESSIGPSIGPSMAPASESNGPLKSTRDDYSQTNTATTSEISPLIGPSMPSGAGPSPNI